MLCAVTPTGPTPKFNPIILPETVIRMCEHIMCVYMCADTHICIEYRRVCMWYDMIMNTLRQALMINTTAMEKDVFYEWHITCSTLYIIYWYARGRIESKK